MIINDLILEYLKYAEYRHKKQGYDTIKRILFNHIIPFFNNLNINDIDINKLVLWQQDILKNNYCNKFNNSIYSVFKNFLDYCVLMTYISFNPIIQLGNFPKRIEKENRDFYTLKEFNLFINCFDNIIYKTYFIFLFYSGCRPSEALALNFSDFEGNYVFISKSIHRRGNRAIDTPKNRFSIRKIALDNNTLKQINILKEYYKKTYDNFNNNYFVFGGIKPLSTSTIDRYKLKACNKCGLRTITQHQFRHSHATLLIDNNIPINEVSRRLGHCDSTTTLKTYVRPNLEQEKRVIKTLNSTRFTFNSILFKVKSILKHHL